MANTIFQYEERAVDFINKIKLPGVLIAKAMLDKTNFDNLLHRDETLRNHLKDIGYTIQLNPISEKYLETLLKKEEREVSQIIGKVRKQAEVFASVLTHRFQLLSEQSKKDTLTLYHLSQIIFIWDEFIDFNDYQKSGGKKEKIRESIFYRTAAVFMQEIPDKEMEKLAKMEIKTEMFDTALTRLQLLSHKTKFTPDNYQIVFKTLQYTGLSISEAVYFLLTIESFLFIRASEDLLTQNPQIQKDFLYLVKSVSEGIKTVKKEFGLNPDKLEGIIEEEAEKLIDQVSLNIFNL